MSIQISKLLILGFLLLLSSFTVKGAQVTVYGDSSLSSAVESKARLKILSWNIGMLPVLGLFKEKDERAQAIGKALLKCDYDIIVFEEAFTCSSRIILSRTLHECYPYAYGPVNGSRFSTRFNSGIWIISKVPLLIEKEIEFTNTAGFDAFARKGAVLLEGQFQGTTFQLIATHLQDDSYPQAIREFQLQEIYQKLILPFSNVSTPQIICGDFNTDEKIVESYKRMLMGLSAEDGEISGKVKITFDDASNDVYKSVHPDPRRIDYVLTRNPQLIQFMSRRIAVIKSKWGKDKEYLSDHNGIEADILFGKLICLSKAE
ncbi:MAG: sphingomyelin phosphodiesterase [Bacteroidota bacterium]